MNWKKLQAWLTAPAIIVGALGAVLTLATMVGLNIETTSERLDVHVVKSDAVHDTTRMKQKIVDEHMNEDKELLEALVRGECLENSRDNLVRQGLLIKCRELGVIQ